MDLGRQDPGLQDPGLREEMDLGRQDPGSRTQGPGPRALFPACSWQTEQVPHNATLAWGAGWTQAQTPVHSLPRLSPPPGSPEVCPVAKVSVRGRDSISFPMRMQTGKGVMRGPPSMCVPHTLGLSPGPTPSPGTS